MQGGTELATETSEGGGLPLSSRVRRASRYRGCVVDTRGSVVKSSPKSMQDVLFPQVSCSSAGTASGQVTRRSSVDLLLRVLGFALPSHLCH